MALTPMMEQYLEIKAQHTDAILFFRLGDFYEMFFDDARLVSRELDLTLTGRDCGEKERAPMCGVPYHAADEYIGRLIRRGYKVVICEQAEDPATAKGLVKREVVRIVTPGTVTDASCLSDRQNNYLCALYMQKSQAGLCFCDVSTGELHVCSLSGDDLDQRILNELSTFSPREILFGADREALDAVCAYLTQNGTTVSDPASFFEDGLHGSRIVRTFSATADSLGLTEPILQCTVGGLIGYINAMQKTDRSYIKSVHVYQSEQYLGLDFNTRRNLELCETMRQKDKRGSLLWVLDRTGSAMGARLLRKWIEMPLCSVNAILERQRAVTAFFGDFMLRQELSECMRSVLDLERLMTRIIYNTANGRDLLSVYNTLSVVPQVKALLSAANNGVLDALCDGLDDLNDICTLIGSAISPDCPLTVREGNIIARGFHPEVDRLRDICENSRSYLAKMEAEEKEKTGIRTLKVSSNRVFGFYIEVSKTFTDQVPAHYIRKQTLANGERYITPELKELENTIFTANDKLCAIEYELLGQIRQRVAENAERIARTAEQLALIDVYVSLGEVAARNNYTCPEVEYSTVLSVKEGRHPVVEQLVSDGAFVPNDALLDTEHNRLALITGPNMAGKSTYMRQLALIVIMAQIGSYVPATDARIGIVDRVFTRVGASDDLASGQSTFMLEMTEVAHILKNATRRSLIIYDEIGRGTSTFDGMSIARATAEYTCSKKLGARCMFATHYHELTELEQSAEGVVNYYISARKRGDDIIFLRRILRGSADDSYGIEVAKLAGVPNEVIRRAKSILASLEKQSAVLSLQEESEEPDMVNMTFDRYTADEIREKLQRLDVDSLTPLEALTTLYELKKLAK